MISDFYDDLFTVEASTTVQSALGSYAPTWSTLGTFYGWIDYLSGRETLVGSQYVDKATHVIGCSSTNSWVTEKHRIKNASNKYFRILHTDNPVMRNHHLEILLEYNETDNLST